MPFGLKSEILFAKVALGLVIQISLPLTFYSLVFGSLGLGRGLLTETGHKTLEGSSVIF